MNMLDVLKALEKRRRKRVEINRSMVSHIQYQADMRRSIDREIMKAERFRLKGVLAHAGSWHPQVARDRYEELSRALGS